MAEKYENSKFLPWKLYSRTSLYSVIVPGVLFDFGVK